MLHGLSTSRVLTMEFVEGANVCDVAALRRLGVRPQDVAKLVAQTFNEMIFTFGDVRPRLILNMRAPLLLHGHASDLMAVGSGKC